MIRTLGGRAAATLKIRDSRFIACAMPVESESEARAEIAAVAQEHPGATHCCYAYRLLDRDSLIERCHDAGEPAGTAGAPILTAIQGADLANVAVTVVRYFGGTKLGLGNLSRAYRKAARGALEAGSSGVRSIRRRLGVSLPLTVLGEARSLLAQLGGDVLSESYAESAELVLAIDAAREAELRRRLDDLSRGRARWRT
jgi:uncharacterized YigZ family protein